MIMSKMNNIYVADFETWYDESRNECNVTYWGCSDLYMIYKQDYGIVSFMEWLQTIPKKSQVWFHNGGKYDFLFIIYHCIQFEIPYKIIGSNNNIFKMEVYDITLKDSVKILPMKLEAFTEAFDLNISKLVGTVDYKKLSRHLLTKEEEAIVLKYLYNDVIVLKEAIINLINVGFDTSKLTLASLALSEWRKTINNWNKYRKQIPAELHLRLQPGYRGGLCGTNIYHNKNTIFDNVWSLDINSSYPNQLYNNPMPYGQTYILDKDKLEEYTNLFYVLEVTINYGKIVDYVPPLYKSSNISFEFSSEIKDEYNIIGMNEYKYLKEYYNADITIHKIYGWKTDKYNFRKFFDIWMSVKACPKNVAERLYAKLIMNSLYGKFGQKIDIQEDTYQINNENVFEVIHKDLETFSDGVYLPVALAAVDYARSQLREMIHEICFWGTREAFLYCDTDSVYFKEYGGTIEMLKEKGYISSTELGKWDIEKKDCKGKFIRPKTYCIEDNGVIKPTVAGLKDSSKYIKSFDDIYEGATYPGGKTIRKLVPGGVLLYDSDYNITKRKEKY